MDSSLARPPGRLVFVCFLVFSQPVALFQVNASKTIGVAIVWSSRPCSFSSAFVLLALLPFRHLTGTFLPSFSSLLSSRASFATRQRQSQFFFSPATFSVGTFTNPNTQLSVLNSIRTFPMYIPL